MSAKTTPSASWPQEMLSERSFVGALGAAGSGTKHMQPEPKPASSAPAQQPCSQQPCSQHSGWVLTFSLVPLAVGQS